MLTFTQDKKDRLFSEIKRHQAADQIAQGFYGKTENGKWRGCAVGCSIHSLNKIEKRRFTVSNHHVYETELGIPEAIARLEDRIFEGLPSENALQWPARFIEAVNPEADLSLVLPKFYIRLLIDKDHGVRQWAFEDGKKAIDMVVKVHKDHIKTDEIDRSAAWSAESAARSAESAAWSAAWSAARSAESAESAAWSAESAARSAESAARSAESAAWSAAWSAARSAARYKHYEWMADILTQILKETK